jgi:HK97 family phage major capsid protein
MSRSPGSRQDAIRARLREIDKIEDPTQYHVDEQRDLIDEYNRLEAAADTAMASTRSEQLEHIAAAAADPANREEAAPTVRQSLPARFSRPGGSAGIWRTRAAWEGLDEGTWQHQSMRSRAFDALDSFDDDVVSRDGREKIAELLGVECAERDTAAQWAVALSDPNYYSAFRSVFRNPQFGSQFWSPAERTAMARVNQLSMRSGTLGTGSLGWALPLVLDPDVVLINNGSANPWRQLSSIKLTTSNTYNGVNSTGATAAWLGEGAVATDATPTLGQIQITPQKMACWMFASYESAGWTVDGTDGDTGFAQQASTFFADAKDRLEEATFSVGATGVANTPAGLLSVIGTASDTALGTGAWSAYGTGSLAAIKEALPPRFRLGQGAKVAWVGSLNYIDKMSTIPAFSGALSPLVDQSGPLPRALGAPIYESSSMATGTAAGTRVLIYGDYSQNYIVDRWPSHVLFEPFISGTGGSANLPSGNAGWFYFARTGMGQTTTGAWRVGKV